MEELALGEDLIGEQDWIGRLRANGIIERVRLAPVNRLTMQKWPFDIDPDIQVELSAGAWSTNLLISDKLGLAFAPSLGPDLCTALQVPGYTGRKPEFAADGPPIVHLPDNGATVIIKRDGTSTLLKQW